MKFKRLQNFLKFSDIETVSETSKPKRNKVGSIPLTPLMNKLSILAENTSDSFTDTPNDSSNLISIIEEKMLQTLIENAVEADLNSSEMKRVELGVFNEKNMTLMVLAEESVFDQKMIQQMFELCLNRLSRLEQKLSDAMKVSVDLKANDYSFISLDKKWGLLQKSGNYDSQSTLLMMDHIRENKKLTDIVLRTADTVVYGNAGNAGNKVFYQNSVKMQNGVPVPSEFNIISAAKRKLERDQSLILL